MHEAAETAATTTATGARLGYLDFPMFSHRALDYCHDGSRVALAATI
jgi:hypothetical protein